MKYCIIPLAVVCGILFFNGTVFADPPVHAVKKFAYHESITTPKHELLFSEGLLSIDQLAGIAGEGPTGVYNYMSFPYMMTGAAFLTYRYHLSRRIFVGATAGLDNQRGDLSYGNTEHGTQFTVGGTTGYYTRRVYTFAAEGGYNYLNRPRIQLYGYLGLGYTSSKTQFNYFDGITDPSFFYGTPTSLVPENHYTQNNSHVAAQVTPFGMRLGDNVAWIVEVGLGYKGLVCTGLSVRL